MKRFSMFFVLCLMAILNINAQENSLACMSEVVQCEGMSINEIYSNIMQNYSKAMGADKKIENTLDYCDKEQGVINIKGNLYLGCHKLGGLMTAGCGYGAHADVIVSYKIKEGRYKLTLTTNSITMQYGPNGVDVTPGNNTHKWNFNDVYPEFLPKLGLETSYWKKASKHLVNENMSVLFPKYFNDFKTLHLSADNGEEDW